MQKIREIVATIRDLTSLSLFGFDVIICATTGRYALIDINYFPGYRGIDNFPKLFVEFLKKKYVCFLPAFRLKFNCLGFKHHRDPEDGAESATCNTFDDQLYLFHLFISFREDFRCAEQDG
jgi:hypothetical protein